MSSVVPVFTFKPTMGIKPGVESHCYIVAMSCGRDCFLPETKHCVSSAYCTTCACGVYMDKSLANIWNRSGPYLE